MSAGPEFQRVLDRQDAQLSPESRRQRQLVSAGQLAIDRWWYTGRAATELQLAKLWGVKAPPSPCVQPTP